MHEETFALCRCCEFFCNVVLAYGCCRTRHWEGEQWSTPESPTRTSTPRLNKRYPSGWVGCSTTCACWLSMHPPTSALQTNQTERWPPQPIVNQPMPSHKTSHPQNRLDRCHRVHPWKPRDNSCPTQPCNSHLTRLWSQMYYFTIALWFSIYVGETNMSYMCGQWMFTKAVVVDKVRHHI